MTTLTIYGVPFSNYVRTVRMALEEKGITYELKPCPPGFEDGTARHPFGKIPFMRYGDLVLAESIAIIRFVERTFPGPALWPTPVYLERAALQPLTARVLPRCWCC